VRTFLDVLDYVFVVVLQLREMECLWQGHVLLVVIRNDAVGNEYCHYGLTTKLCCSVEKRCYVFFCGRGDLKKM
jgi:hypothetical protein